VKARIIRTAAAEADLADIWSSIAADSSTAADKLLARIDVAFDLIGATPKIGFEIEDIQPNIRCKPVRRNYLVFYQVFGNEVVILRVLHAARKFEDLL